jgi:hypothetical protein
MLYYMLAQERVKDAHREADKNRLIAIAKRSRRTQNRQRLAKMGCCFGLTQFSKWLRGCHGRLLTVMRLRKANPRST